MKKIILALIVFCSTLPLIGFAQTNNSSRGKYGGNPIQILDTVVSDANDAAGYQVQQTALDSATDKQ
ncbi:MAG: hypothetical protein WCP92_08790 [bacterium]